MGYHLGLANYLVGWGSHTGIVPSDRFLIRAPMAYGAFHRQFLMPLAWGASTALATQEERRVPVKLMAAAKRQHVTVFDFMPTAWRSVNKALSRLSRTTREALLQNDIRLIVAAGEPLDADVVATWRALNGDRRTPILNVCGGTEISCITVSYDVPAGDVPSPVPIGGPVCGATVYLLDEQLRPVPYGESGEICYGGPNVTRGYLNRPSLTAEKFVPDPIGTEPGARLFRSGDIARYLPDGSLQHLRRSDLQVKLRGFRVELEEVEAVLAACGGIEHAVVAVTEHGAGDRRLIAYVVPEPDRAAEGDGLIGELRAAVRQQLPAYMRPSAYVLLDQLPLTASGKLDRRAMPAPDAGTRAGLGAAAPPGDRVEAQLLEIWQAVLGVTALGVYDDFFDVGGDSILAVAMLADVEARTGHDLPLATLLYTPTIAGLAASIRQESWLEPDSSLVQLRAGGDLPPLFLMPHGGLHVLCYRTLAGRVQGDRAVYGLEPKGVDGRVKADVSVDEQAQTYLAAIRRAQPRGPYYLAGLSGGGLVAWEMAQRLAAAGEQVALLAMFDTSAHSYLTFKPPAQRWIAVLGWWLRERWRRRYRFTERATAVTVAVALSLRERGVRATLQKITHRLTGPAPEEDVRPPIPVAPDDPLRDLEIENWRFRKRIAARMLSDRLDEARQVSVLGGQYSRIFDRLALRLLKSTNKFFASAYAGGYYVEGLSCLPQWKRKMVHEHVHVWRAYEPKPYPGRVVLFRAAQQPPGVVIDPFLGWQGLARGGMDVVDIEGTHTTIVHSEELARVLNGYLERADSGR